MFESCGKLASLDLSHFVNTNLNNNIKNSIQNNNNKNKPLRKTTNSNANINYNSKSYNRKDIKINNMTTFHKQQK
jgi:hypothetical protein